MQHAAPHLLVPMMPTPNGPLHLGHAAGPYLKMDVLARFLRQRGHRVALVTTTDCFENHVLQSAARLGIAPLEVCAQFHEAIRADFAALDIGFDAFLNPTAPAHADAFKAVHAGLADRLFANGAARLRQERHLADAATGEPLLGHRLVGRCSRCDAETVGFVCEHCGLQMTTELLREPRSTSGAQAVWHIAQTLALEPRDTGGLLASIQAMRLPAAFKSAMADFLDRRNIIRLSALGDWGVGRHTVGGEALMLYNSYFGHALFCAEVGRQLLGGDLHPFTEGSGIATVTSCGLDNATDLAASLACAAGLGGHRSFDHCLGNFFLHLRGRKFSTGADHAVFVRNVARNKAVQVDALRLYLAQLSPEEAVRDFAPEDFAAFQNGWFAALRARIDTALRAAATQRTAAPSNLVAGQIEQALRARDIALSPAGFTLSGYAQVLRDYAQRSPADDDAAAWLQGLAVLAWPLAPRLAGQLRDAFHGAAGPPRWEPGAPFLPGTRQLHQFLPVPSVCASDLPEGLHPR